MLRTAILTMLLMAVPGAAPAAGQVPPYRGAGISGGRLANDVDADYIGDLWGPPDSVRLAAAVLWRDGAARTANRGATSEVERVRLDSLREDAQRRGMLVGGTENSMVLYDPRDRSVVVLDRSYAVSHDDSTTVLMVERPARAGDDPVVSTATIACSPTPGPAIRPGFTPAELRTSPDPTQHWEACLLRDTRVAAFLARRPPN